MFLPRLIIRAFRYWFHQRHPYCKQNDAADDDLDIWKNDDRSTCFHQVTKTQPAVNRKESCRQIAACMECHAVPDVSGPNEYQSEKHGINECAREIAHMQQAKQ